MENPQKCPFIMQKNKKGGAIMKERLQKLLCVKSIVTIGLTMVFCYLSVIGVISAELFMTVYTTIVAFYFGVQTTKTKTTEGKDDT